MSRWWVRRWPVPTRPVPTQPVPSGRARSFGLRRSHPAAALLLAALWVAATVACGADDPPPTSPLAPGPGAEASPDHAAAPDRNGLLPPLPTDETADTPGDTTGDGGDDTDADAARREAQAASALSFVAQVLGVPERDLSLAAFESLTWPDACIGIERPGILCGQVQTPGWRAVVPDALGSPHTVHGDEAGRMQWAGERTVEGALVAVDVAAGLVELRLADGAVERFAIAPGTGWFGATSGPPVDAIGAAVTLAVDAAAVENAPAVIAWLAVDP